MERAISSTSSTEASNPDSAEDRWCCGEWSPVARASSASSNSTQAKPRRVSAGVDRLGAFPTVIAGKREAVRLVLVLTQRDLRHVQPAPGRSARFAFADEQHVAGRIGDLGEGNGGRSPIIFTDRPTQPGSC